MAGNNDDQCAYFVADIPQYLFFLLICLLHLLDQLSVPGGKGSDIYGNRGAANKLCDDRGGMLIPVGNEQYGQNQYYFVGNSDTNKVFVARFLDVLSGIPPKTCASIAPNTGMRKRRGRQRDTATGIGDS
ncbi:hypothetical protein, partial [Thiolapillus sp.]|uniref:hypothetical protein n=2 Tax=Thiolapillus sp. TaxID=2017437 RepID=UPI003AF5E2AA